jgi:hypothetical protein
VRGRQVLGDKCVMFLSLASAAHESPRLAAEKSVRRLGGLVAVGLHKARVCCAPSSAAARDAAREALELLARRS